MAAAGDSANADPWSAPGWNSADMVAQRRATLGLEDPKVKAFTQNCEMVSLGSYCGAAFALQALGLKQRTYPFDWVRSPVSGVIRCLLTGFADFLKYVVCVEKGEHGTLYGQTSWGGSFWHHNPDDPKTKQDFDRRAKRMLGHDTEVPANKPRVFVRIANSSTELAATAILHGALKSILPESRVYLLVLVDMQPKPGPVIIPTVEGVDLLFYNVDQSLFGRPDLHFAEQMECCTEAYAQAVACALRIWSQDSVSSALSMCTQVPSLEALTASCQAFDAGDAAVSLFTPQRLDLVPVVKPAVVVPPSATPPQTACTPSSSSTSQPATATGPNVSTPTVPNSARTSPLPTHSPVPAKEACLTPTLTNSTAVSVSTLSGMTSVASQSAASSISLSTPSAGGAGPAPPPPPPPPPSVSPLLTPPAEYSGNSGSMVFKSNGVPTVATTTSVTKSRLAPTRLLNSLPPLAPGLPPPSRGAPLALAPPAVSPVIAVVG